MPKYAALERERTCYATEEGLRVLNFASLLRTAKHPPALGFHSSQVIFLNASLCGLDSTGLPTIEWQMGRPIDTFGSCHTRAMIGRTIGGGVVKIQHCQQ